MKFLLPTLLGLISLVLGDLEADDSGFKCNFGGKEYSLGERISTPDTACFVCTCHKNFVEPSVSPPSSCAIIDCPWTYYQSKPHCSTHYTAGECCPELRCSAPAPRFDHSFLARKRLDESTDGYEITTKLESELTIYCKADSTDDLSHKEIVWKHKTSDGTESTVANTTKSTVAFFPPATWALYFPAIDASDDGLYTCHMPTTPPQTQTTRIVVRTEPRPPLIDPICHKPAFSDIENAPCPDVKEDDLPWYYNTNTGDCTQHTEKSCKWGTENHFPSMSACWDHCLDDCYAQSKTGPCDALIPRYYYNHPKDTCESFAYGGCGGNLNNFQTVHECEDKCADTKYRLIADPNKSNKKKRSTTSCSEHTECSWKVWLHYVHKSCQPIFEDDACCPQYFDCTVQTSALAEDSTTTCTYKGQTYNNLFEIRDECLSCICNDKFNQGDKSTHCQPLCNAEEMDAKIENGCIPVYENNKCCPVDWQCPPSQNTAYRQGGEETRPKTDDPNHQCHYGGQNYALGFELISGYKGGINCTCLTPPTFTCTVPSCPEPLSVSNEMLRCKVVFKLVHEGHCPEYKCWNILEETQHVGQPLTIKEKQACKAAPCQHPYECIVNYTQCHLGECQRECRECAVPMCQFASRYESPLNECPTCVSLSTPEEACEINPNYCPGEARCEIFNVDKCRHGSCEPSCILEPIQPILVVETTD